MSNHKAILIIALGLGSAACNSVADDRIESICSCNNCPEKDREIVTARVDAAADVADTYECSDQLDAYWTCELSKHECQDSTYEDDTQGECSRQYTQLDNCAKARSSADNEDYYGGNFFKHR